MIRAPAIEGHWLHENTRPFGHAPTGRYRALRVVEALKAAGTAQTPKQLSEALEIGVCDVMTMAHTCEKRGLVRLTFRGQLPLWELT